MDDIISNIKGVREPGEIVINNFHLGMASSPYTEDGAVANIVNMDAFFYPGRIRSLFKLQPSNAFTVGALAASMVWIISNPNSSNILYGVDKTHQLFRSANGGLTWSLITHTSKSTGTGNGLVIWKGYLFLVGNAKIDYISLTNLEANNDMWSNNWSPTGTLITNNYDWHPCLNSANDGFLYIGNGPVLARIQELTGETFDPTDNTTYSSTNDALAMPDNYQIRCLSELRESVLIGTVYGGNGLGIATIGAFNQSKVFPWTRGSTPSYDFPFVFDDGGINAMINIYDIVYVVAGPRAHLYSITESGLTDLGRPPINLLQTDMFEVYPGAMANIFGKVGFSISNIITGSNAIYGIITFNGNGFATELVPNNSSGLINALIGAIYSNGSNIVASWIQGTTYGVNYFVMDSGLVDYISYFESLFYKVGIDNIPGNFSQIDVQFAKPLVSGDGIKVYYRKDTFSAYNLLATIDYDTYGSFSNISPTIGIYDLDGLQLKVTFKGAAELIELRLVP